MSKLIKRIKVVLTAAPTWLTGAGIAVAVVSEEVAKNLPAGWQDNALQIGGIALGIIASATQIVRKVTPVFGDQVGLLPPHER